MINTSQTIIDIEKLIEEEQYNEASNLFLLTIDKLKASDSPILSEYYYEYALFLFNMQEYEMSILMFQSTFNLNYKKEDIESFLYQSFITPNNEEFKETYERNILLSSNNIISTCIPEFDELPIDFIPFEENKYFIFNRETKTFDGIVDLTEDSLKDYSQINFSDEFSDIVFSDSWNISAHKDFILSSIKRNVYYISSDIRMSLSFLKLPNIMERYCPNLKFIDSLNSFQSIFHINTSIYLPRLYYGNKLNGTNIMVSQIIEEEHQYRLTPEGRNTSNILFTIGIPSYNRGHRVLKNIQHLLQLQYDAEIEFVVSNNGSTVNTEGYEELKNLQDSRINYFEYSENQGPHINFCQVLIISHGKYTCLLSDEDSINLPAISHYLSVFQNNPNISFATSSGLMYYKRDSCRTFEKGSDAFLGSFLNTNYVSGLIYRTDLVHSLNLYQWTIDNMCINKGVDYYSHSCWVMFLTLFGDYYEDNMLLFMEGCAEEDQTTASIGSTKTSAKILPYGTLESRMEQHNGFIKILNQFVNLIDRKTFLIAYLKICHKTFFLMSLVKKEYETAGTSWSFICSEIYKCCIKGIANIEIELSEEEKKALILSIHESYLQYNDYN